MKISVIVPVYDVEAYLPVCVESILNQTHRDLELILVDDGSPDACPALCDAYGEQDPRVRVIHQENRGLSGARNAGLDMASGEFVVFIDSDDAVSPCFLELLLSAGAEIAQCGFSRRDDLAKAADFQPADARTMTLHMLNDGSGAYTVAWNKLWKRCLWDGIRFPEGKRHEDEFTSWRVYQKAKSFAVTEAALYYYRPRAGSIMDEGFTLRSLDALEALRERADFFLAAGDRELAALAEAVYCHRLRDFLPGLRRAFPEQLPAYRKALWVSFGKVLRGPVRLKKKLTLSVQMLCPRLRRLFKKLF